MNEKICNDMVCILLLIIVTVFFIGDFHNNLNELNTYLYYLITISLFILYFVYRIFCI